MESSGNSNGSGTNGSAPKSISYFMNTKNWWGPLTFIAIISILGVGMIGFQTYHDAPPMAGFISDKGDVLITKESLVAGQIIFHKYALMEYGSFFGDGAQRGPDFTAEALHQVSVFMTDYKIANFKEAKGIEPDDLESRMLGEQVKDELKVNRYDKKSNTVMLSEAQTYAYNKLITYYTDLYIDKNTDDKFPPVGYIASRQEVADLSSFFFWGAWVCVTQRPGSSYSYTHNWPFDPDAGNTPTSPVILWSVLGLLGFVLACGLVLYYIGQYNQLPNKFFKPPVRDLFTIEKVRNFSPTKTQRATFKFFFVAILLFFLQVSSGLITINDFINYLGYVGINIAGDVPVTISRSWHLMLALYWISTCWIASSIFILPILSKKEVPGQLRLINILFVLLFILVGGSLVGMVMGPLGLMGEWSNFLGHQGWEFVDFGKAYQILLMGIFILWGIVVYRGIKPSLIKHEPWNLPNWIMYSVIGIPLLFLSGFVARPETNFVIADF